MDRLLIAGSGDVALRSMAWLRGRFRIFALVRRTETAAQWRAAGAVPLTGDLDDARSLKRLAGLAEVLLYCAPPPARGRDDPRLQNLLGALGRAGCRPRCIVYVSTSGVYGDCGGAWVCETRPVQPTTDRAMRRIAAEQRLRAYAIRHGCALRILRAPGIYAAERLPLARLERGDPVLREGEDVFTNHIHADDLARACGLALFRGGHMRVFNVCDDAPLAMGAFYESLADIFGLPRPPRASRAECAERLSPLTMSFMSESRQLDNARIKRELRWTPRFADVRDGLRAAHACQQREN